jgi:hypothetical protein
MGYDIYTTSYIVAGNVLVSIPCTVWRPFSAIHATKSLDQNKLMPIVLRLARNLIPNNTASAENLIQTISLALTLANNPDHPYIDFLYQSREIHSLLMGAAQLAPLAGTQLLDDIYKRQKLFNYLSTHLTTDEDRFLWAISMIQSRGISGSQFPYSLVPMLDLANHSDAANA